MNTNMYPIFVLLGFVIIGRFISESGIKKLNPDEKVRLLDEFSDVRKYSWLGFLLILLVGFQYPFYLIFLLTAYILGLWVFNYIKMKKINVRGNYMWYFNISMVMHLVGLGVYLLLIL